MRFVLSLLLVCILASCAITPRPVSPAYPDWNSLGDEERAAWEGAVLSPLTMGWELEGLYKALNRLAEDFPDERTPGEVARAEKLVTLLAAGALLRHRTFLAQPEPDGAALREWVAERRGSFDTRDRLDLQSIFLRRYAEETDAAFQARIAAAKGMLDAGTSFRDVAMHHSDATSRGIGGSAGTIHRGTLPPAMDEIIFNLPEGEVAGPIDRPQGTYFFRVNRIRPGYDFDDPEGRAMAIRAWQGEQAGRELTAIVDAFMANHTVEFPNPEGVDNWLSAPWIVVDGKVEADFFTLVLVDERVGFSPPPAEWNEHWADEAGLSAPPLILGLAALEQIGLTDPGLQAILPLLYRGEQGRAVITEQYHKLEPTEEQLRAFYDELSPRMDPITPRYTALLWTWRPDASGVSPEELATFRTANLDAVFNATRQQPIPANETAARALFEQLMETFPGSRVTAIREQEFLSPAIDPILLRTNPGELSLPYDDGNSVGLVYMIEKGEGRAGLEASREGATASWKTEQVRQLIRERME